LRVDSEDFFSRNSSKDLRLSSRQYCPARNFTEIAAQIDETDVSFLGRVLFPRQDLIDLGQPDQGSSTIQLGGTNGFPLVVKLVKSITSLAPDVGDVPILGTLGQYGRRHTRAISAEFGPIPDF